MTLSGHHAVLAAHLERALAGVARKAALAAFAFAARDLPAVMAVRSATSPALRGG
jgi:hypothetical protein